MKKSIFKYSGSFTLESGEKLDSPEICYHSSGEYTPDKKVVWICHGLTANSNPAEWWSGLTGEGKLFDPAKYYVICVNIFGSCYGSTGPVSPDKQGNLPLLNFPLITIRDMVNGQNLLRKELGIKKIDFITGASIGGFQALEWSIEYPDIVDNLFLIACNAKVSPWGTAFNEAQRMALMTDPTFKEQKDKNGGKNGLETARAIALISYRSYEGYDISQKEEDKDFIEAKRASSYQNYQGKKLSDRFDSYSYYTLTRSLDSHNVGRGRGGIETALAKIKAKTVIAGIETDTLFPTHEQKFLTNNIKNAEYHKIDSLYGHDGFLLEFEQTEQIIRTHFSQIFQN